MKNKIKYYQQILQCFLTDAPDKELLRRYLLGRAYRTNDGCMELQDFIGMHLKKDLLWVTGISIIDAADNIYDDALSNGNIEQYGEK